GLSDAVSSIRSFSALFLGGIHRAIPSFQRLSSGCRAAVERLPGQVLFFSLLYAIGGNSVESRIGCRTFITYGCVA
ncbi:MAG TPA: hypothetical protein VKQ36_03410, partial [Ktedonobacterales bacterium]|nr:hypothetical protein [Ktedonobacterales bacterium]